MKLSFLLAQRQVLLRQARLAHLAHAYDRLDDFARRVARTRLRGQVHLQASAPESGNYSAALTALHGAQSVIEEHFTDDDITGLADVISDVTGQTELDLTFPLEELAPRYLAPLRQQLEHAGVTLDDRDGQAQASTPDSPADRTHSDERG